MTKYTFISLCLNNPCCLQVDTLLRYFLGIHTDLLDCLVWLECCGRQFARESGELGDSCEGYQEGQQRTEIQDHLRAHLSFDRISIYKDRISIYNNNDFLGKSFSWDNNDAPQGQLHEKQKILANSARSVLGDYDKQTQVWPFHVALYVIHVRYVLVFSVSSRPADLETSIRD